jgi:hypothetical protein
MPPNGPAFSCDVLGYRFIVSWVEMFSVEKIT